MKYSKDDILQILISQYQFQIEFAPDVVEGMDFDFESSIFEWIDACDLVAPKTLAKYYLKEFRIDKPLFELENILTDEHKRTVSDFCEYISKHAKRENIEPLKLLGQHCQTASIFRTLKQKLSEKGVDTTELKPNSEINPFFLKYGAILIDEINRIAPGTMSEFEYKSHKLARIGQHIMFIGIFGMVGIGLIWKFNLWLTTPIILGIVIFKIGDRKQPEKLNLGGYQNFRELIYGMENKLKKT